jgi:hypothetical protein
MLTTMHPIRQLEEMLSEALYSFLIPQTQYGHPELVEKAAMETERIFQNATKAMPSKHSAYAAALKFLRGQLKSDDEYEYDLLASAVCEPIMEQNDNRVVGAGTKFSWLIKYYEEQLERDDLWRLTWYGLMSSYFAFDPIGVSKDEQLGWESLRSFLERTWKHFGKTSGPVPEWIGALKSHHGVFSDNPCGDYAEDFLNNNQTRIEELKQSLSITKTSWFWHKLILAAVRVAVNRDDVSFREALPQLIELLKQQPVFRDEAIEALLIRYYDCKEHTVHEKLRDFVIDKSVWKNPKLKMAGGATSWNRLPDSVWRMVLGWVTESNLRLFFQFLAARNQSDEGRFNFWSRYLGQIGWTKLVFSQHTLQLGRNYSEIRELIQLEDGVSAKLSGDDTLDAFLMEIGGYIVVEFSKKPNAAYIYPRGVVPFDIYAKTLSSSTDPKGLKAGYNTGGEKITHTPGWEKSAALKLASLGIRPDLKKPQSSTAPNYLGVGESAPVGAQFTMRQLSNAVNQSNAHIDDKRNGARGRLWIQHDQRSSLLAQQLKSWGFSWSEISNSWYYPD